MIENCAPKIREFKVHKVRHTKDLTLIQKVCAKNMYLKLEYMNECKILSTGKSLSEALIFASSNPQYDDCLLIEFQAQTWGEQVVYRNCF